MSAHLEALKACQNQDGGWGYYTGKPSWLEPTIWAALALHGDSASDRAWALVRQWQLESGAWRASANVPEESWTTSLMVLWHCVRDTRDSQWRHGLDWLLASKGATTTWWDRFILSLLPVKATDFDSTLAGWPWRNGTSSWVEPTAHAVNALRHCGASAKSSELDERIDIGERLLIDRRCKDGGWNYGYRWVLGENLESYPECTGLALIGLNGARQRDLAPSFKCAQQYWSGRIPNLGRALLRIALRLHGVPFQDVPATPPQQCREVAHLAFEALGDPGGNWKLLRAKESA